MHLGQRIGEKPNTHKVGYVKITSNFYENRGKFVKVGEKQ